MNEDLKLEIENIRQNSGTIQWFSKRIKRNETLLSKILEATKFLSSKASILERVYCIEHDFTKYPNICCVCGKEVHLWFQDTGYKKWCSSQCANKLDEVKQKNAESVANAMSKKTKKEKKQINEKRKETCLERYGVEFAAQTEEAKQKIRETNLERYGVDNPNKSKEIRTKTKKTCEERYGGIGTGSPMLAAKIEQTMLERYGAKLPLQNKEIYAKMEQTNLQRYGVKNTAQVEEKKQKMKATSIEKYGGIGFASKELTEKYKKACLERYGFENPLQNAEIYEKVLIAHFRTKDYTLPSGKVVKVQGYEPKVIDELLQKYSEDDLVIDNKEMETYIGKILYTFKDSTHRYYPDIFIIPENKVVEVKSTYTYEAMLDRNLAKKKAVEDAGFNFEFVILD